MNLDEFNEENVNENILVAEDIYNRLADHKSLPYGDFIEFDAEDLIIMCQLAIFYLKQDSMVLNLKAPLRVIGDVHGEYNYLWKFLKWNTITGEEMPKYLFLGDYVDRGANSIETFSLLLCLKILHPQNIFLIRGNHETPDMTASYGFREECLSRYQSNGENLYLAFLKVFEYLPLAAVIRDSEKTKSIFCVHGGISPEFQEIKQLEDLPRPFVLTDKFPFDILWSDPCASIDEFDTSGDRIGVYRYGKKAVNAFMEKNKLTHIFRAHEIAFDGYAYPFTDKSVITLFSAPNYCGELNNKGAMIELNGDFTFGFHVENPTQFSI